MGESGKISGVAIGVATAGLLLTYAGFRGASPKDVLKDLSTGNAPGVNRQATYTGGVGSVAGSVAGNAAGQMANASANSSALVSALVRYKNDEYSQALRSQVGYSDCSSFVGKGLRDIGVKVPGGLPITTFYLVWTGLTTINKTDIKPGDLLCAPSHMAVAIGNGMAVGQQNTSEDVNVDTIANIMYGTTWIARRLKANVKTTGKVAAV